MTRTVLVVDDTLNIQNMLKEYLESQDFSVVLASDGREALAVVRARSPDLILLDVMMPAMDGFQFLSRLRAESDTPVIMISARQQEADIVRGFELGADDYITKPFRLRELLMRIRAVMRRAGPGTESASALSVGDIVLDAGKHEVLQAGTPVELTPLEFHLLEMLMASAGKINKRQEISIRLMDRGFSGSEATLKIHIGSLRAKLGDNAAQPRYIETVFGIGYRFIEGDI